MQSPGSLPHASPENTKTTLQPLLGPALKTEGRPAAGRGGNEVPGHLSASNAHFIIAPSLGAALREKSSQPGKTKRSSGVTLGPALCSETQL